MKRTQAIELPEEEIAQQKEWMRESPAHLLCGYIRMPNECA